MYVYLSKSMRVCGERMLTWETVGICECFALYHTFAKRYNTRSKCDNKSVTSNSFNSRYTIRVTTLDNTQHSDFESSPTLFFTCPFVLWHSTLGGN